MRLKDVDRIRELFDKKFTETRKLILEGETHLNNLAEGFKEAEDVILEMPTIDAVPVSELLELRDRLCEDDLIFMQGLGRLNHLIAKYAKDGGGNG